MPGIKALVLSMFMVPAFPILASGIESEDPDWERLIAGEILVEKIRGPDGMPGILAQFTIQASRDELWEVLTDYQNFSNIYRGIDSVHVIAEDMKGARVEIFQDIRIKKIRFVLQRQYEEPGRRLSWDRVSGDLKIVKGSWDILDTPDKRSKLVVYTSYFKLGGLIPARLSRNWAMGEVKSMAETVRIWINEHRE